MNKLTLKREQLSELTIADLTQVGAGIAAITGWARTCPVLQCLDPGFTDTSCNCCTASGSC